MLKICKLGEEVLRKKSVPIKDEEINDELRALAEEMFETMESANGVGLACPQIGKNIRMFVAEADDDVKRVFINPQIIATSDDSVPYEEGCLSVPQVYENIMRPSKVTVQAQDQNGKKFTLEAEGLLARIIQHENDHLEGVIFIDRGDADFAKKTAEQFAKRAERAAQKAAEKEAKAKKIAAKIAAKKAAKEAKKNNA
ncbi:MAG: peptide deformylase [Treponema sp.]|nr:peptide deformylase [Treponema sp.]MBR3542587.1 peptide deformylase [Treponema sp.]MEE3412082.1 peptide deformylase [Treponema sp.]MEE3435941.1 peptide deformylase [Treponema sp.]